MNIGDLVIPSSKFCLNIGITFDSYMNFDEHIKNICRIAFYYIRGQPFYFFFLGGGGGVGDLVCAWIFFNPLIHTEFFFLGYVLAEYYFLSFFGE